MVYKIFSYCTVVADAGSFPASIVSTRVTLVELKAIMLIPAHVEQWYTKWPFTCTHTHTTVQILIFHQNLYKSGSPIKSTNTGAVLIHLQTVYKLVWCHRELLPAVHRELAPGIEADICIKHKLINNIFNRFRGRFLCSWFSSKWIVA